MEINLFFDKWNGKFNNTGSYRGQCVNLVKSYFSEVLNKLPFRGNAIDYWKDIPGFTRIKNTIFNAPQFGDLVVWGTGINQYGHVAICQSANIFNLTCFGQNWPLGSPCHFQKSGYKYILGWLRPNIPNLVVNIARIGLNLPPGDDFKKKLTQYSLGRISCNLVDYSYSFTGSLTQDQAYKIVNQVNPKEKYVFLSYQGPADSVFYVSFSYPKLGKYITTCPGYTPSLLVFELSHLLIKCYNDNRGSNPYIEDIDSNFPSDELISTKLAAIIPYYSIIK